MTDKTTSLTRRTALKKGGLVVSTLSVGTPAISGSVTADESDEPLLMDVDLPPAISSGQKGTIVTAIYPKSHRNEGDINDLEEEVINRDDFKGFKLGPERENDDAVNVAEDGADHDRIQILPTGNMGVFFDPATAKPGKWFTPDDTEAKLSAINKDDEEIAWGFDDVTVKRDGSEARRF